MMILRRSVLPFAVVALLAPAEEAWADPPSRPRWECVLEWLPEDTETVVVAPGPFNLPKQAMERIDFHEVAPLLAAGSLPDPQDELLRKELGEHKVLCAVEGSRRFTAPRDLGMMPYQGCHVLQFESAADDAVRKAFRAFLAKAEKKIDLAGEPVAVFTKKQQADVWTYFVVRPRPGVLICATDQGYLEETLKRIGRKPKNRALPADLPEWKHVDVKARVWAIRHYRKEFADKDPSSPLRPGGAWGRPDPSAVGFVFWYNPDDRLARVRYLSGAKDAIRIAERAWKHPSQALTPKIRQVAPGAVEITTALSQEEAAATFYLILFGCLGHAIYL